MKQEGNVLEIQVADLREEIESLRESNLNTAYRIRILEEEFEIGSDHLMVIKMSTVMKRR